ncbi:hypothetical protein [Pedobacter rhizosphaerae]|jgi:hypothetical protein|uniref:Uncharacterized protein n=1 Tax=Pedobacter rhizosphaerae TaxID=390241 RepID=A0A1H9VV76_9SPHI|nr:hypothetical protein [Pedobacter rhizosphaerae]SES25431.1 hypothetical protein SAMN04488023_15013 [Pedobacter rhizosphaerae]
MENEKLPEKRILKPSVIHDDLPEVKKPEHLRKKSCDEDDLLPENPERHFHHEELRSLSSSHEKTKYADDDEWNGEDA